MTVKLEVMSNDPAVKVQRELAAERVLRDFDGKLPDLRLLAFLDDRDDPDVKKDYPHARGISGPIKATSPTIRWLVDLTGQRRPVLDDYGIYLHGTTCVDETALTMTLAHELQHFVQCGLKRKLWAESRLIRELPKEIQVKEHLNWPDIPHEREARIVAKRVGVSILGADEVRQYIGRRISDNVSAEDVADWRFSQNVDPFDPYDLSRGIGGIFQKLKPYRNELEQVLQRMKASNFRNDYKDVDLSKYFDAI